MHRDSAEPPAPPLLPITRHALHEALCRQPAASLDAHPAPLPRRAVDDLWELLDANGDGVLTAEELHLGVTGGVGGVGGVGTPPASRRTR